MTDPGTILRVAAKGDGVTQDGRHVPGTAPGDTVAADGTVTPGPHHAQPPCRHFPKCGGCQLQHLDEESWADFVSQRVVNAAEGQGLDPARAAPPHLSPPRSRRRATLHGEAKGKSVRIGFREGRSHRIVDMQECHVLRPELFAMVEPLRRLVAAMGRRKWRGDIELALTDQGVDCTISGLDPDGLREIEALGEFASGNRLARLTLADEYGPQTHYEPDPVTVTFAGVPVDFPAGAFLQATADGEAALSAAATSWLSGSTQVADLFAGLGTFSFALAAEGARVTAIEGARDTALACRRAAGRAQVPMTVEHRDLYRNPVTAAELATFDAVLLDPPRAGAREQVAQIAQSTVSRVCYVSCNPASWAKDAAALIAAGYRLEDLRPVGQFRWSTHVELASLFVRTG